MYCIVSISAIHTLALKFLPFPQERADHKIPDALVRLSVGIEHIKDIIADLEQAFKKSDME